MQKYRNTKVLVVDDMSTMQSLIKEVLRQMGFIKVATAGNGKDGLNKAKKIGFDLIISDWDMPTMTGLEFLKAVRADEELAKTPFLMLTANADKDKVIQALQAKVTDYIAKPFQPVALVEKVNKVLA